MLERKQFAGIADLAAGRKRTLGVLMSLTYDADRLIAWRAAEAQGWAAGRISGANAEFVRSHLRRLHWLLSEESGGICRHAPQSMAEIVVRTGDLFSDYGAITATLLTDMADEDLASGFRAAVLWAVGRLGPVAPESVSPVISEVEKSLEDPAPDVRGLSVWCLLECGRRDLVDARGGLSGDRSPFEIYREGDFVSTSPRDLLAKS
jgi:hypothetical protein